MSYDLYRNVFAIANANVKSALRHGGFNAGEIKEAVDESEKIAEVARQYWSAQSRKHKASEKVKAAKVLGVDESDYQKMLDMETEIMDYWIERMTAIVSEWTYSSWGSTWTKKE